MAATKRIDSHQHFWRYRPAELPWIDGGMSVLQRDFLPPELEDLRRGAGLDASVAVQARARPEETDWLLSLAGENPAIAGVVGWADFTAPDFSARLEAWAQDAAFCGLRPVLQEMPDPAAMMADAAFNENVAGLQGQGKSFDLLLKSHQLPGAADFCARHEAHWIILDHGAKPAIAAGEWETWHHEMARLAALPHVVCKLSGLVTEADWRNWRGQDLRRYARAIIELFGPARVLFGSDWPVCTLAADYQEVVSLAADAMAGYSAPERAAMFGGNAARIYNLRGMGAGRGG
jgi:L-fucono-1,5-lactonase